MEVEKFCQRDVERHCEPPKEIATDPIMQWMLAPPERLMAPPMIHPQALAPFDPINVGPLLDHMMDSALRMQSMMQPEEPVFFMILETTDEDQRAPEEHALDSMISKLIQHSNCDKDQQQMQMQPEETHDVTHHIRLKGQEILSQENVPEDRVRLARRLTEVTPEEMMKYHHHDHPWHPHHHGHHHDHDGPHHMCPKKHKCLMQALEQNLLQPECAGSLIRLEKVHEAEMRNMEETQIYMAMFQLYCILFFALFTMIVMRKFNSGKGLYLMRLRVLQAVYSNPEIKAKVEDEVGVPLGNVPPLPTMALKMLSESGRSHMRSKRQRFLRMVFVMFALLAMDAFGLLPPWWPLFMMGSCCGFLVIKMVGLCFSKPEVRECNCCCCGGSTLDVENGTVSDAQACCTCCKGSGICAVKCRTCCGTSDKDGGGCCGGSCGCSKDNNCDGSCGCCGDSKTKACAMKKAVVVVDCTCCCCGGSTLDVQNGTVSNAQACCTCCKGSGVCALKCRTCCGTSGHDKDGGGCCGGSCSCSKDHNCDGSCGCCGDSNGKACSKKVMKGPTMVVYQGVPMQIV